MTNLIRDIRHAGRVLANTPGFTLAAVLTLALGIGANTAAFTLADAVLLRPVQVRNPHELVVWSWSSSFPDFQEYARRTDVFDSVVAVSGASRVNVVIDGSPELTWSTFVSGNAFDALGVGAAHGRPLLPSDDVPGGAIAGVLGHDYWRSRFGGDPAVVGRTVRVNGRPVTIAGVLERGFRGLTLSSNAGLYLPTAAFNQVQTGFFARTNALANRGLSWLSVIGRLRPDVPVAEANARMTALYAQLHPRTGGGPREALNLEPLVDRALGRRAGDVRTFVRLLAAVVGLTLLIVCTNLANLLLARGTARRREIGVRLALGARRSRVIRQLLIESLMLAGLGGLAGLLVARGALTVLSAYELPGTIAIANIGLEIDGAALAATMALSVCTGLLFGTLPAWRASRVDVLVSLRDGTRGATGRSLLRSTLLGVQVAICLVLVAGAGLFARTVQQALGRPLGFDVDRVVKLSVNAGLARYDRARATAFYASALERVSALPQVESAAWASMIPTRTSWVQEVTVEPVPGAPKTTEHVHVNHVGPGYFRTLGTRVLSGREFRAADGAAAEPVVIVNRAMARTHWGDRSPIGARLGGASMATVIGVVEDVVDREIAGAPVPYLYFAFNQSLSGPDSIATDSAHLFVRARLETDDAIPMLRGQLLALDPELPLFDAEPFADRIAALLMPQRMGLLLFAFFSTIAVALATVGVYGVASYGAALRTREIGVRVALGASPASVRRMLLWQAARPVAAGIVAGLALALYLGHTIQAFLIDISPFDAATLAVVTATLAAIALVASVVPARRAAAVDPVRALRYE
jgi:predicted permease